MTTPAGKRVYDTAAAMLAEMPSRELRPGQHDVIVIHERANHGVHPATESHDGSIFESAFGGPLLGRRTARIVIDRNVFFDVMWRNDAESRHRQRWMRETMLCRLEPGGQVVLV